MSKLLVGGIGCILIIPVTIILLSQILKKDTALAKIMKMSREKRRPAAQHLQNDDDDTDR